MMFDWLQWLPWIGGAGMIGYVLLAIFAQPLLSTLSTVVSSVVPPLVNFVVWFSKDLVWPALNDIFDDLRTAVLVLLLMTMTALYFSAPQKATVSFCKPVIDQLHKDYTFIPKKKTTKTWSIF
jgi:hypothetical protein